MSRVAILTVTFAVLAACADDAIAPDGESGGKADDLAAAPTYVVRDLGTLPGGATSHALGLNDDGVVVGWSTRDTVLACADADGWPTDRPCRHAFRWQA